MPHATCSEQEIIRDLKTALAAIHAVQAVHSRYVDPMLFVWIGIRDDDMNVRREICDVEERISTRFPDIKINFRVIPLTGDKTMEEYVSSATPLFRRAA